MEKETDFNFNIDCKLCKFFIQINDWTEFFYDEVILSWIKIPVFYSNVFICSTAVVLVA